MLLRQQVLNTDQLQLIMFKPLLYLGRIRIEHLIGGS